VALLCHSITSSHDVERYTSCLPRIRLPLLSYGYVVVSVPSPIPVPPNIIQHDSLICGAYPRSSGKEVFKDKSEWLPVKVPAIVEPELFHKARERVERNRQKYMNPREIQMLSNLVKCGECGGSCTGYKRFVRGYKYDKQKKKLVPNGHIYHRVSYICSRRIRQELHSKNSEMKRCSNPQIYTHRLESAVQSIVEEIMTNETKLKDYLIGYADKPNVARAEAQRKLKAIEQKILDFTNCKKGVVDLYARGEINRAEYGKKCQQYDAAINAAKNTRTALLTMIPALHQKNTVESSVESYCNSLKSRLQNCADFDTRRQLMLNFVKQIVLTRGKVEVHGSIPIELSAYSDPDQSSEASEMRFVIEKKIECR
jgi:site-specific DNA recombinase